MLAERLEALRSSIADAATVAGRNLADIHLIAVTKFQPAAVVRELYELGVRDFGESRHQEARAKAAELSQLDLRWHFVGQLQTKKARQVRAYANVIHSIDRASLVDALSDAAGSNAADSRDCFVQLNLTDDPGRGGVAAEDLEPLVERVVAAPGLRLLGVMAVAPLGADPRRSFAAVRAASQRVAAIDPDAVWISAGMSGDYREAILEGATHLRIGTAITGNRPAAG
jgi:pyridoxal phosphate enzyme (YggS family)